MKNNPIPIQNKASKAHVYSSIHAYIMVVLGVWSFYETGSKAYFLPVLMGVPILTMNNGLRYQEKVPSLVALFFTVLAVLGVGRTAYQEFLKENILELVKSGVMITAGIVAAIAIVKSISRRRKVKKLITR